MSRVSLMALLLCSQITEGFGRPAETTHSSRTLWPVRAITLLLRPGPKAGNSVGSSAISTKLSLLFEMNWIKSFNELTFNGQCGGSVGIAGLVTRPAFKQGTVFDKDLRKAELAQAVLVRNDVIATVIDTNAVLEPRNEWRRVADHSTR